MLEHAWQPVPQYQGSPYEERLCSNCHLKDIRNKDDGSWRSDAPNLQWKVVTACIEEVPQTISYHHLVEEVFAQVKDRKKAQELIGKIRCIGVPGKWAVGIVVNGYVTYPEVKELYNDYEAGFAEMLRWLRARQFDPYKYSDLHYREQLASSRDRYIDDD